MFQVTAIFQGAEVGYGEGEGLAYSLADCIESIDSFYLGLDPANVMFRIIGGRVPASMPMDLAVTLAYA